MNNKTLAYCAIGAALVASVIFIATDKTPKYPDTSIVEWGCVSAEFDARAFAEKTKGKVYKVAPTGSMEPYLTGGDFAVMDPRFPFRDLKPRDSAVYQANWLPPTADPVVHMVAGKYKTAFIMTGIANPGYEMGKQSMTEQDYRGKVTKVFTERENPEK